MNSFLKTIKRYRRTVKRITVAALLIKTLLLLLILLAGKPVRSQIILTADTFYYNEPVQFNSNATGTMSQVWYFGDGDSSTSLSPVHHYTPASCGFTSFIITLQTTDSNNTTTSYHDTLVIKNQPPVPALADQDPFTPFSNCDNSPGLSNPNFTLTVNNATADTAQVNYYTIDWGDNSSLQTINNQSFPLSHTYSQLGLFYLTVTAFNAAGCSSSKTYEVANQSNPAVGISSMGSTQGCAPQQFTFILSQYQNNSPGTWYVWDFGDGSPQVVWNYNDPFTNDSIRHTFQTTSCNQSNHAFTVSVTAHNHCDQTTATVSNIRIYSPPIANFSSTADTSCTGTTINFTNSTQSGFGYSCNGNANYLWDFGDGTTSSAANPQHSWNAAGTYTVRLVASNGVCGLSQDSTRIVINTTPQTIVTPGATNGCDTFSIGFSNQSMGGNLQHLWNITPATGWSFDSSTTATASEPVIKFSSPGIYSVHYSALNNCSLDDTTITITARKAPQINLTSIGDYCGQALITPVATVDSFYAPILSSQWSFPGGNPASSNTTNPGNIAYSDTGSFIVSLTVTNQCGSGTSSTGFTVYPLPHIQLSSTQNTICQGDTVVITATGGVSYQWQQSPGAFQIQNNVLSAAPSGTATWVVSGTDSHQCTQTDTLTVQVNALPTIHIVNAPAQICSGDTIIPSATGGSSYTWAYAGLPAGNAATVSLTPLQSGSLTVTGYDSLNCHNTDTVLIQVFNPPALQLTPAIPQICAGDTLQLTASGAAHITLSGSGWQSPSPGNFLLYPSQTTSLTLHAYDLPGCVTDSTITITVHPLPQVTVNGSSFTACIHDSIPLSASGATTYQWHDNHGFLQNGNAISYPVTQNAVLIVNGTDSYGCSQSDTAFITANPLPVVSVTASDTAICTGDSAILTATGGSFYNWNQNPGNTASITVSPAATATYTVTATDTNGCSNTAWQTIEVYNPPQISWSSASTTICQGDSIGITLSGANLWLMGSQQISSNIYLHPSQSTTYTITGKNANHCSDTVHIAVTVHPLPVITATASAYNICLGQSAVLTAAGGSSYQWLPSAGLSAVTGSQVTASPTASVTYSVTGTDSLGCSNSDSVHILVSTLSFINLTASSPAICQGDTVTLTATGALNYQWTQGPNILQTAGGQAIANPAGNATYAVTGTDSMGCVATQSVQIQVHPLPAVQASVSKSNVCPGDSVVVTAAGALNYLWNNTNATGSTLVDYPVSNKTWIVTGTDTNGCRNSDTVSIQMAPLPLVSLAANDTSLCPGQQVILTASGAQVFNWSSNANVQQSGMTATAQPAQNQWYWVKGTNNFGCSNTDSLMIIVHNPPVIQMQQTTVSVCAGDSVHLTVNAPGTVSWSPASGLNQTNGHTVTASPAAGTTYLVTAIDSNGCSNSAQLQVTVNPKPQASFVSDTLSCVNSAITFTNNTTGGNSFQWTFGDGGQSSLSSPVHSYQQTGAYTVKLKAVSTAGCIDSIEAPLTIIDSPTADFSMVSSSGCSPFTTWISDSSITYGGSYFWSFGNGLTLTSSQPGNMTWQAQPGHDTSYIVTLTTSNICGTSLRHDTVWVMAAPTANFGFITNTSCSPVTATFGNISSANATAWWWNLGDSSISTAATPPPHTYTAGNNPVSYPVTLIAGNQCGSDTMVKYITVNPNYVHAVFTPDHFNACAPAQIHFTNYSNIQNMASWNFGDGSTSALINPTHIYQNAGNYQVSLVVTDNCGIDTAVVTIQVGAAPAMNFSISNDSICQYAPVQLTNNTPVTGNILWLPGDSTQSSQNPFTHSYQQAGTYQIMLIGQDAQSQCTDTATAQIVVFPASQAVIHTDTLEGCYPLTVNFSSQSSSNSFQQWDFDDGNTSTAPVVSETFSQAGNYQVKLFTTNYYGCNDTAEVTIKAYPHPVAAFTTTQPNPCSFPAEVHFNNQSSGASGFFWNFGNGSTSGNTNPVTTYLPGNYQAGLIAYNIYQCSDTTVTTLSFDELPHAAFSTDKTVACAGDNIQFINHSTQASSYIWNIPPYHTVTAENPKITFDTSGIYFPVLVAFNNDGCSDTAQWNDTLVIHPTPQAAFSWSVLNTPKPENGNYRFTNLSTQANDFFWDFGDGFSSRDINPVHQYYDFGDYDITLYASNEFGCSNQLSKRITVDLLKGLYIPTALAPNHPNPAVRLFTPKGKGLASLNLAIYDSWGNIIWQTTLLSDGEPAESWDGTVNGRPVPQGVYYWKASAVFQDGTIWQGMPLNDGRVVRSGTVTLLR